MKRNPDVALARVQTTDELWGLLEMNLSELARQTEARHVPPERRQRTKFALACARELKRRGKQGTLIDSTDRRASRNAILGMEP